MSIVQTLRGTSYAETEFFERLAEDIRGARRFFQFNSGFITRSRVSKLELLLATQIRSGVRICCYIQEPDNWNRPEHTWSPSTKSYLFEVRNALEYLRSTGVHANLRQLEHEKVAVIDNSIIWDGSLNILSFGNRTHERMTRWVDPVRAADAIKMHRLNECPDCARRQPKWDISELDLTCENLGRLIRARRIMLGLRRIDLARAALVDRKTIARIEDGLTQPNFDVLMRITRVFGRNLAWIPPVTAPNVFQVIELESEG